MGRYGVVPLDSHDNQLAVRETKKPWLSHTGWLMGLVQPYFYYRVHRAMVSAFFRKEGSFALHVLKKLADGMPTFAHFRRVTFLNLVVYALLFAVSGGTVIAPVTLLFFAVIVFLWPSPETRAKLRAAKETERKMLEERMMFEDENAPYKGLKLDLLDLIGVKDERMLETLTDFQVGQLVRQHVHGLLLQSGVREVLMRRPRQKATGVYSDGSTKTFTMVQHEDGNWWPAVDLNDLRAADRVVLEDGTVLKDRDAVL